MCCLLNEAACLCSFRWVAFRPEVIGWWGSCLRLVGAVLMGTGSIVNFINQTAHVAMSPTLLVSPCLQR